MIGCGSLFICDETLEDALPENLQTALPTIEELETELAKSIDSQENDE